MNRDCGSCSASQALVLAEDLGVVVEPRVSRGLNQNPDSATHWLHELELQQVI